MLDIIYIWIQVLYFIIIMNTVQKLSQSFLLNLYLSKKQEHFQPILQILGFETSEQNQKQIIIRLSDGNNFFDATLIGPYDVVGQKIVVSPFTAHHGTAMQFKRYDVIKIVDFFSKIDDSKICRLKMMIRKIVQVGHSQRKLKRPQELSFHVQLYNLLSELSPPIQAYNQPLEKYEKAGKIEYRGGKGNSVEIKICDDDQNNGQVSNAKTVEKKAQNITKEMQILSYCKDRNPEDPLTYRDIVNGYDGFFIGRLLRIKQSQKDSKDGPLPMLSLGFLDSKGEMMRLNLLGKMAIREQKQLKIGKCYYLKGLQMVHLKGSFYIKLREKDYSLRVLNQQRFTSQYLQEYYHWQHEYDYIQNQNVDVIGIVQDIQEKSFYGVKQFGETKETKEVIRVVIRNKFKTVKISFWSDQLKNLAKYNLKKGEVVMIEDVKKKKIVFLDFSTESNLIKLSPDSEIYKKLEHLLPQYEEYVKPINISQIYKIAEKDKYSSKVHTIYAFLSKIQQDKVIFKMCDLCKKKINLHSPKCLQCRGNVMSFNDYSGSINAAVFDSVAQKLFAVSALRMKQIKQNVEEYDKFIDMLSYSTFLIGIEVKNDRFILRSVELAKGQEIVRWGQESLRQIHRIGEIEGKIIEE